MANDPMQRCASCGVSSPGGRIHTQGCPSNQFPSLRDQFAMAALVGAVASLDPLDWPFACGTVPTFAYKMADAMLAAQEVKP